MGKMEYNKMSPAQLEAEYAAVSQRFEELKGKGLKLDMASMYATMVS